MKNLLPTLWLVAASFTGSVGALSADEITLKDGRIIDGQVVSPAGSERVEIRTRTGGMIAVLHLKAEEVVAIRYGKTEQQKKQEAFDAKCAAMDKTDGTAEQWWALAEEAKALGENTAYRHLLQTVVVKDEDFAPARAALGQIKQDGRWMKPAEAAAARGEVFFRGKWMQAAEREGILGEEARVASEAETQALKDRNDRLAAIELATKEAQLRAAEAEARRAAAPAPSTQIIYSNYAAYSPYPTVLGNSYRWRGCPTVYPAIGGVHTGGHLAPVCPAPSGLSVQAAGQGGITWGLSYR